MPADIIPSQMVEEALEAIGEAVEKKVGGNWWVKPLYWLSIVVVLSIPILYYFWYDFRLDMVAIARVAAATAIIVVKPGVSSEFSAQPPSLSESIPPHAPSVYQHEDHVVNQSPCG